MRRFLVSLLALCFVPSVTVAADDADETVLKGAGLPTDGPGLLEFVKQRARPVLSADELTPFTKDLGSADPTLATKASAALILRPLPSALRVVNDLADKAAPTGPEVPGRIEGRGGADVVTAAVGPRHPPTGRDR